MHTAFEVKKSMFDVNVNGDPIDAGDFLHWGPQDRFGILIDRPVGALGGGLLIHLAICSFYDVKEKRRRQRPLYPDIYLFHAGGPWGSFISFDFWPERKEVFLDSDPKSALSAINSYGITHLAIPDREPRLVEHIFKEPEAAIDQIKKCFVYDPTGTTKGSDVTIATTADKILANYDAVLEMDRFAENVGEVASSIPLKLQPPPGAQMDHVMEAIHRRAKSEAWRGHPDYEAARHRLDAALSDGYLKEGYRSISVKDALLMLGEE